MDIFFLENEVDAMAWDEFVIKSGHSNIYQLSSWRYLINSIFGHLAYYICARDEEGRIAGILPLIHLKSFLFGNFLTSMPYFNYGGCLAVNNNVRVELHKKAISLAESLSASHVEFRDLNEAPLLGMAERIDKVSMRLALPEYSDELWAVLGAKLRSQIKRPLREKPNVKTGGIELLDDFYKVFSRNMRDLGTPVYDKAFFRAILEAFDKYCHIVVVYSDSVAVAAGFLIGYKGVMEIPWASSLKEYNRFGFNMLMYWEALKLSIENGSHTFDFGRSSVESGTYRFKKQWGATPVQMNWHYWLKDGCNVPMLNPSNPKYRLAIKAWKKLPLPVANMVGPLLVKNLP